jgi:hypothetical protein
MARASKSEPAAVAFAPSAQKPAPIFARSTSDLVSEQVQKSADPSSKASDACIPTWNQIIKAKVTGGDGRFPDAFSEFLLKFKYPYVHRASHFHLTSNSFL